MSRAASVTRSRALFGLLVAGVLGAALLAVRLHESRRLAVPEWPLAVDLVLVVPLAYLVVFRLAVTAATLYGGLFLFAEYRATRLRPVTLDDGIVHLRYGIVTDARLAASAILEAQAVDMRPRRARGRMRLMGMGRANVRLTLAPVIRLRTVFGEKEVAELYIGLDEPGRFIATVSQH